MAEITASMVKDLREKTGAGMMDCKRRCLRPAVTSRRRSTGSGRRELQGRPQGLAGGGGGADRPRRRGPQGGAGRGQFRNRFRGSQSRLPGHGERRCGGGSQNEGRCRGAAGSTLSGPGPSIADKLSEMVATIGENMNVRRTAMLSVDQGVIGSYLHNQIAPGLGKIGVLVAVDHRQARRSSPVSPGSSRCTSRRPTRSRSTYPGSPRRC